MSYASSLVISRLGDMWVLADAVGNFAVAGTITVLQDMVGFAKVHKVANRSEFYERFDNAVVFFR